ncbi:phage/plasmid primase, P4 family [Herbaspirillum sp. YR522]|uniref:phage/plasmid primase, P4 family n=1 Tax=Herbaspirillum sp. YR522 TaxID=1144342 RepID=UPI00026F6567|nr:phage/plasmid primase, P4 family [Herbaspirillum sp. YR522]EJM98572.1 phage/plasmid primase, P4 family containing protein [Herbaspirillum sp. YR522]
MTYFNQLLEGEKTPAAAPSQAHLPPAETNPVIRAKELLTLDASMEGGVNFDLTKELAFECQDDIFERWIPDGEIRGKQYAALNPTRNDGSIGSFTVNTENGVWKDFAGANNESGSDLISLVAYVEGGINQTEAARLILQHIASGSEAIAAARVAKGDFKRRTDQPEFIAVMPVPEDALTRRPIYFGARLGKPTATWAYRNAAGEILFLQNRFDTAEGKTYLPQTYCKDKTGHPSWQLKAPPEPRPAYGLDRLATRPEAPVLFTEGEKAADAAQSLFPDFVAVTTLNGAKSPEKTDLMPFAGRTVYIAPDNDEAGIAYAKSLNDLLSAVGAQVAAIMDLKLLTKPGSDLPKGYDLADALRDGWTSQTLADLGHDLWIDNPWMTPCEYALEDEGASVPASPRLSGRKQDPSPMQMAKELGQKLFGGHLACFDNKMLAYAEGYWKVLKQDLEVRNPILNYLGDAATPRKINTIFELIRTNHAADPAMFERRSNLICLKNGTLEPISGRLLPHSPDHKLTNALQIKFLPEAECALWLQTLEEIFAPDADKESKIRLLQEFSGYCLIPDTKMHKFLWLVGAGGNGKSLVLSVLQALVGSANISNAAIERLQDKFVRAELFGKLVNISSEMSAQATISDGYLKQITAGDEIEAERKFEPSFSFRPYARLIGATNSLPRLLDHSDGFARRAIILQFNRQFKEHERDIHREEKLMAELPGILNWAVTGLQNLLRRGKFDAPPSSHQTIESYRLNSDPVRQFLLELSDEAVMYDFKAGVRSSDLYQRYRTWATENGYQGLSSSALGGRVILP